MLCNTLYKLTKEKRLNVAYFGGSITEGAGASSEEKNWRRLTTRFFREKYPDAEITETSAAIGGTGSELGLFRMKKDLLEKRPDLIFVEFAVNDSYLPYETVLAQTEALVRKILAHNAYTDIIPVITTEKSTAVKVENGEDFESRSANITVAYRYGLPFTDMGSVLYSRILSEGGDWLKFTCDSVHPNDEGYEIYAKTVRKLLERELEGAEARLTAHILPERLCRGSEMLESAEMTDCAELMNFKSTGFILKEHDMCGRYPRYIEGLTPGARFSFDFEGHTAGFYWELTGDGGDLLVSVDGGEPRSFRAWDTYCLSFDRAGHTVFLRNAENKLHHVEAIISETAAEQSKGHAIRIGALLKA